MKTIVLVLNIAAEIATYAHFPHANALKALYLAALVGCELFPSKGGGC